MVRRDWSPISYRATPLSTSSTLTGTPSRFRPLKFDEFGDDGRHLLRGGAGDRENDVESAFLEAPPIAVKLPPAPGNHRCGGAGVLRREAGHRQRRVLGYHVALVV